MRDLALAVSQTRYSLVGFLRNPRAFVFTIVMPLFLLVIMNTIFRHLTNFTGGHSAAVYYTPAMVGYQVTWTGFATLGVTVVTDREAGLLKRFRGTPMPSWVYLAAEMARTLVVVVCTVAAIVLLGAVFYAVPVSPSALVGLAVYTVVGTAAMSSLGLAITRVCPTTDSASALGPFVVVILAFISGVFVPLSLLPSWMVDLGRAFPLEHLAAGLRQAFARPGSTGITLDDLGALALWGLGASLVSVRVFRWEPLARH
jgi:ABC-2 type transport system permease protein